MNAHIFIRPCIAFGLSVLLACSTALAIGHDDPAILYLRSGTSLRFRIISVHPWGVTDEQGQSTSYHVMDSLFTTDSSVAHILAQNRGGITMTRTSAGYLLSYRGWTKPDVPRVPQQPLVPHSISLLYRYDGLNGVAFQFDGSIQGSPRLFHRFQGALTFGSTQRLYATMGFAFGLGYHVELKDTRFTFAASYALFGGHPSDSDLRGLSTAFVLSPMISYEVERTSHLQVMAGMDLFPHRQRTDILRRPSMIFVGCGTRF